MISNNVLILHQIVSKPKKWSDVSEEYLIKLFNTAKYNNTTFKSLESRNDKGLYLTFDDGYLSDYQIVLPLLIKYDFTATFFICIEKVGKEGYMNWRQINELNMHGMEIGSHSLTHSYFSSLSKNRILEELSVSKERAVSWQEAVQ